MLQCPNCGEAIDSAKNESSVMFKYFRGAWTTWESLFAEAGEFASQIGPERLISISHSEDRDDAVITVWYWG